MTSRCWELFVAAIPNVPWSLMQMEDTMPMSLWMFSSNFMVLWPFTFSNHFHGSVQIWEYTILGELNYHWIPDAHSGHKLLLTGINVHHGFRLQSWDWHQLFLSNLCHGMIGLDLAMSPARLMINLEFSSQRMRAAGVSMMWLELSRADWRTLST